MKLDNPFMDFALSFQQRQTSFQTLQHYCRQFLLIPEILLFIGWHARFCGGKLTKNKLRGTIVEVNNWHEQVTQALKQLEQDAERLGQNYAEIQQEISEEKCYAQQLEFCIIYDQLASKQNSAEPKAINARELFYNLEQYLAVLSMASFPQPKILLSILQDILQQETAEATQLAREFKQYFDLPLQQRRVGGEQLNLTFEQV